MFDPIEAPDAHRGPATGHTSEHGTTWQEAASRINAAFKALFAREMDAAAGVSSEFVAALEARFEKAEDVLSDALFKIDALERRLAAYGGFATNPAPPTEQALDPNGQPATGAQPA